MNVKRNRHLRFAICILVCSPICGCQKAGRSSPILATGIGIIETSLHLWEADEGIRGFIKEKGWSYSQEFINSWTFKLIATTPESDIVVFECRQERSQAVHVTISITKNGDSGQQPLANELTASLKYRYDRTRGLKAKAKQAKRRIDGNP